MKTKNYMINKMEIGVKIGLCLFLENKSYNKHVIQNVKNS